MPYTTLDTTPISREKPYLFVDDEGGYNVRVPSAHRDTRGITWADGVTPGRTISISDFFVADPSDSVQTINNQLARGKHLILTPGVYDIGRSIEVKRADTVVLGMGQATLHAINGAVPLRTADKAGIIVAGVTIDAGEVESPALLQVGKKNGNNGAPNADPDNPVTLSDVYFRVGGPYVGKTDIAVEVNSDHVLIDHTWVWRADHGIEGFDATCDLDDPEDYEKCEDEFGNPIGFLGDNIRWETNIGRNGAVINGDDVTATGLFVEHFQEYNTVWNGERGQVYLYQNELPYDPPTQADWTADDGTLGWAAYKVADHVKEHMLWGAGSYIFNRNNPTIVTENGYEVPDISRCPAERHHDQQSQRTRRHEEHRQRLRPHHRNGSPTRLHFPLGSATPTPTNSPGTSSPTPAAHTELQPSWRSAVGDVLDDHSARRLRGARARMAPPLCQLKALHNTNR